MARPVEDISAIVNYTSAVGWVERSDTHHFRSQERWVSVRSTHPTVRFSVRHGLNRVPFR